MADETKTAGTGDTDNRRQFFLKLGLGSLGIAVVGTAAFAYQFLDPNVLYEPSPVVNAGKPDRYPLDSVTLDVNSGKTFNFSGAILQNLGFGSGFFLTTNLCGQVYFGP